MTLEPFDIATMDDPQLLLERGIAAARRNDKQTARAALRKATKLAPDDAQAWLALADVVGTFSERRQAYGRVLELDPGNIQALGGLQALDSGAANPHPIEDLPPLDPRPEIPAVVLTHCYRHPDVETGLRCIQCGNPICPRCAYPTPVGNVCPDCRKARRSPLYNVAPIDALKAAGVGFLAGAVGAFAASFVGGLGFFFIFFILFFVGPIIGETVMRVITWATNKRGPIMQAAASISIAAGALAVSFVWPVGGLALLIFLGFAIGTVIRRLK